MRVRKRFWVEAGFAMARGLLAVLTLFWREWIEVTGWDPDDGDGSAEWITVLVLAAVSVVSALVARIEWRQHAVAER